MPFLARVLGLLMLAFTWLNPGPAGATIAPTTVEQWCMAVQYGTSPRCVSGKDATHADYDTWIKTVANAYMGKCGNGQDAWVNSGQYYHTEVVNTSTTVQHNYGSGGCDGSPGPYWNTSDSWKKAHQLTSTAQQCPANSTLQGGSCVCSSGYQENAAHTACEPIPAPNLCTDLTGKSAGTYNGPYGSGSGLGLKQLCITEVSSGDPALPGCRATGEATFGYQSTAVGSIGDMYWQAQFAFTGEKCNPNASGSTDASGTTPTTPPAPGSSTGESTQCPIGKVPGEVNGVQVCVTPGTDTPQQRKNDTNSTEQKADGTTVEKTTSKQTVCDATKCVTTTTTTTKTTPPGGTASTTTETSTSSCVVGSPDCTALAGVGGGGGGGGGTGSESGFGGDCATEFSCKGDAVQCAVALSNWQHRCLAAGVPDDVLSAANAVLKGDVTPNGLHIDGPSLSGPGAVTGSCVITDFQVSWMFGTSLNVPMSQVCQFLDTIRSMIGVLGALAFAVIVFKG